jgi:SpoVK/Ycf46/Vps4 family AAA+-type ATPase
MDNFFQQAIAHHNAMARQFFNDPFFGGGGFSAFNSFNEPRGGRGGREVRSRKPARQTRPRELQTQQLRVRQPLDRSLRGGIGGRLAREGITAARPFSSSSSSSSSSSNCLGGGWFKRSNPSNCSFKRCGSHTVMSSSGSGGKNRPFFIATFCNDGGSGRYRIPKQKMSVGKKWSIEVNIKTTETKGYSSSAQRSSESSNRRFHIVFGWQESSFYTLVGDAGYHRWQLEKIRTKRGGNVVGKKIIASESDDDLKTNRFYHVLIDADGKDLHIEVNGRNLFANFEDETGDSIGSLVDLEGEVGVGAHQSKTIFKDFVLISSQKIQCDSPRSSPRSLTPHQERLKDRSESKTNYNSSTNSNAKQREREKTVHGDEDVMKGIDPSLVVTVERDIIHRSTGVSFDDVVGLDDAKRLLKEAVTLPLLLPEMFTGLREPWRGVLLFGPPGCGKTMLAKAAADTNKITFFNVSSATIVNKWRGESEKIVRTLFALAGKYSPSIVFFDEIDAISSTRGSRTEHDADRRLKSLMFSEIDGIGKKQSIMVLATTNRPWDIDEAMRRRLEKRIYVGLPSCETRAAMIRQHIKSTIETKDKSEGGSENGEGKQMEIGEELLYDKLAVATEGFSGADIRLLCR